MEVLCPINMPFALSQLESVLIENSLEVGEGLEVH